MQRRALFLLVCLALTQLSIAQTLTIASQTVENTSACSFAGDHGCYAAFDQKRSMDIAGFQLIPNGGGARYRAMSPFFNMVPMNVSGPEEGNLHDMPIRSLFPGAPNTKLMVHFMPWFYENSDDHLRVGYTSNTSSVIDRQLNDIKARGYGGIIVDWNGDQWRCRTSEPNEDNPDFVFDTQCQSPRKEEDVVTQTVRSAAANKSLEFAFMLDQAAYGTTETCLNIGFFNDRTQVKCIQGKIEADLLAASAHFGESNYSKHNGRPIVYLFVDEDAKFDFGLSGQIQIFRNCTPDLKCQLARQLGECESPGNCWNMIWRGAVGLIANSQPIIVFRNSHIFDNRPIYYHYNGIRHVSSDGMYAWVTPDGATRPDITPTTQSNYGDTYLQKFYDEATCTIGGACSIHSSASENTDDNGQLRSPLGMLTVASVYKGFDNYLAFTSGEFNETTQTYVKTVTPEKHRVMAQRCGATWLDSWERINKGDFNTIGQNVNIIQVATWNDYDEGTAIEPGIENCFTITGSVVQGVLHWAITTPGDTNGPHGAVRDGVIRTLDHFEIFYEDAEDVGGTQIQVLADHFPVSYYYSSVSSGNRCVECRYYHYYYQRDVSSILANYPNRLVNFYVKMIGKPGMVNKISSTIPSDVVLSTTRSTRPSRNSSGQNSAFMQELPPVPPEDQGSEPGPIEPPPDPGPDPEPCGDGPCQIEGLPLLPPIVIGSSPSSPAPGD